MCEDLLESYINDNNVYFAMLINNLVYINTLRRNKDIDLISNDSNLVNSIFLTL